MTSNLVIIDSRVANYQLLIDGLSADTEWVLLDADQDGVRQIEAVLVNYRELDSIQIVSHGSAGTLYLGSTKLDGSNLSVYAQQLQVIGRSLTATGDLLLYGCNVAAGAVGQAFIRDLADVTGADVAASNDLTGSRQLGGDWVLEQATANIEVAGLQGSDQVGLLIFTNTAPTFDVLDGVVTTNFFPGTSPDYGRSVALQADGKILVAGESSGDFALARYNSDGTLDTTFDADGQVTTSIFPGKFGYTDSGYSVDVQEDGKILVAGSSADEFALARYNTDGSLDTSFSLDGVVAININSTDAAYSVTIQSDGKILVAGSSTDDFALARFNTDGTLDQTFGAFGMRTTDFFTDIAGSDYGRSVTVQADGKILVAGYSNNANVIGEDNFALARYNSNGYLDTSFDLDGMVTTDFGSTDRAYSVAIQGDGKILLAGSSADDFALARYNTDGTLDTSFDGDGRVTTNLFSGKFGDTLDYGSCVAIQTDGKILVTGSSSGNFALARYNNDGSLDTSFDGDGIVLDSFAFTGEIKSLTIQPDGKILVAGQTYDVESGFTFALARYNTDGSLDLTFSPPESSIDYNPVYDEGGPAVILDLDVEIFDAELNASNNYSGSTLTLSRQGGANAEDVFSGSGSLSVLKTGKYFSVSGITVGRVTTNAAGTLTLTFNDNATQSLVNQVMQQIAYANTSDAPPPHGSDRLVLQ